MKLETNEEDKKVNSTGEDNEPINQSCDVKAKLEIGKIKCKIIAAN